MDGNALPASPPAGRFHGKAAIDAYLEMMGMPKISEDDLRKVRAKLLGEEMANDSSVTLTLEATRGGTKVGAAQMESNIAALYKRLKTNPTP